MKLVKLSLAAVVAAGAFSAANAVALDEAIQNVELHGMLRYRYEGDRVKENGEKNGKTPYHKTRAVLKLASDIADNFKAHATFRYDSDKEKSYGDQSADTHSTFKVREAYLEYNNFDTQFNIGKMEIGSIWTDGLVGDGITITNKSIDGVTLAAFMFDNFDKTDSDLLGSKEDLDVKVTNSITKPTKVFVAADVYNHNLYGVAAIADFDPVSAQLWVSFLNKVGTFYATDLAFSSEVADDLVLNVHGQYAGNSLKGDLKKEIDAKNGNFFALEGGVDVAGLDAKAGWVMFGDKKHFTIHSLHDKGQLINSGEIIMDGYHGDNGRKNYFFGEFGYTMDGLRAGFDVVYGTNKTATGKEKAFEITPRLSYKYSDKLKFSSFYAIASTKNEDGTKDKERQLRLEAKYTF